MANGMYSNDPKPTSIKPKDFGIYGGASNSTSSNTNSPPSPKQAVNTVAAQGYAIKPSDFGVYGGTYASGAAGGTGLGGITLITGIDGTIAVDQTSSSSYDLKIAPQGAQTGQVLAYSGVKWVPSSLSGSSPYAIINVTVSGANQSFTDPAFSGYSQAQQMVFTLNGISLRPLVHFTLNNTTDTVTFLVYLSVGDSLELNPQGVATNPNPNSGVYSLKVDEGVQVRGDIQFRSGTNTDIVDNGDNSFTFNQTSQSAGSNITVEWTNPQAMPVQGLFYGTYNGDIAGGSDLITNDNAVLPKYFSTRFFVGSESVSCGQGMRVRADGAVMVVSAGDSMEQDPPFYTTDGATFNQCTAVNPVGAQNPSIISYNGTYFWGVGPNDKAIWYSGDGLTFTSRNAYPTAFQPSKVRSALTRISVVTSDGDFLYLTDPTTDNFTALPSSALPNNFGPISTTVTYNQRWYMYGYNITKQYQVASVAAGTGNSYVFTLGSAFSASEFSIGQYITTYGFTSNSLNNQNTNTQVTLTAINAANRTLTLTFPSSVSFTTSAGSIVQAIKLCSLDSNFGTPRYEFAGNYQFSASPSSQTYLKVNGGFVGGSYFAYSAEVNTNTGPTTGLPAQFFYSADGLSTWSYILAGAPSMVQTNLNRLVIGASVFWVLTGNRYLLNNTNQGYFYYTQEPLESATFTLMPPVYGDVDYNRVEIFMNTLYLGKVGGVSYSNVTNNIYMQPGNIKLPQATYRVLGRTSADGSYLFYRRV